MSLSHPTSFCHNYCEAQPRFGTDICLHYFSLISHTTENARLLLKLLRSPRRPCNLGELQPPKGLRSLPVSPSPRGILLVCDWAVASGSSHHHCPWATPGSGGNAWLPTEGCAAFGERLVRAHGMMAVASSLGCTLGTAWG